MIGIATPITPIASRWINHAVTYGVLSNWVVATGVIVPRPVACQVRVAVVVAACALPGARGPKPATPNAVTSAPTMTATSASLRTVWATSNGSRATSSGSGLGIATAMPSTASGSVDVQFTGPSVMPAPYVGPPTDWLTHFEHVPDSRVQAIGQPSIWRGATSSAIPSGPTSSTWRRRNAASVNPASSIRFGVSGGMIVFPYPPRLNEITGTSGWMWEYADRPDP